MNERDRSEKQAAPEIGAVISATDGGCSVAADMPQSIDAQLPAGWPPAEPPGHGHEWPRVGWTQPSAHDSGTDS